MAEVGRQVCRGLDFAHTLTDADGTPLGIVHRDVTPPNIMVAWNGDVKILDFGLARAAEALRIHQSDAGMVRGKMSYLAPELLDGATADPRSDVFSLGVVLHELLSGQRLFVGETDFETLKLVQTMTIPRPSSRNPGVKPALDGVVMRALERDPARRYQSAGEMGDELEALVLRKSYSTRALARKARELADLEPPASKVGPTPLAAGAPPVVGRTGLVDDRRRVAAASRGGAGARRPRAGGARPRGRWRWLAVAVSCVLVGGCWAPALRRESRRPRWRSRRRRAERRAAAAARATPPRGAPAATVRVALDSAPQGATVSSAAGTLGKTPLTLQLPRSQEVVELKLTKPGFAPLAVQGRSPAGQGRASRSCNAPRAARPSRPLPSRARPQAPDRPAVVRPREARGAVAGAGQGSARSPGRRRSPAPIRRRSAQLRR